VFFSSRRTAPQALRSGQKPRFLPAGDGAVSAEIVATISAK
jgi:hypothetical protein